MSAQPRYLTIGDVAGICGVAVVTVRAWEQRYGWPQPLRSRGAHRRYDARDRDAFVRVAELRRSMSTRHAIGALRESQSASLQPAPASDHMTAPAETIDRQVVASRGCRPGMASSLSAT